jgi:hypothetical protein
MSLRMVVALAATVALAGCASPQAAAPPRAEPAPEVARPVPVPMIEYPPIEPAEPPIEPAPSPAPAPAPEAATVETAPAPSPVAEPSAPTLPATPPEPTEDQQLAGLLSDLQRYAGMNGDDVRREINSATQALARQRTDINRVRLAVLYTLVKSTPQDDQRALQLLEIVVKGNSGSPAVKQLAAVLQAQVAERMRAVRDEQQKADAAIKKLEALRSMERDLLRDRIRSGGGGAGGGSSGGGGGGGGGG